MRLRDGVGMALGGLRERKTRTALTIVGIVIGSSMIVALYASTQGQSAAIEEQLGKLGPTTLIVRAGRDARFNATSLDTVLALEGVETAFLSVNGNAQVTRAGITGSAGVIGVAPADLMTLVKALTIAEGELYTEGDLTVAFIGATVGAPDPDNGTYVYAGDPVTLSAQRFGGEHGATPVTRTLTVSGIAAPFGSAPFVDVDNTVFIPIATAQQLMSLNPGQYNQIIVIAADADQVTDLQTEIRAALGNNAIVLSGTQLASTVSGVYKSVGRLLGSVAAISLIVAGVGIANTMFVSVLERVTEIGTLKALGFKAREILGVFLLEASLTGLIGGVLGSLLGVAISFGIGQFINVGPSRGTAAAQGVGAPGGFGRGGGAPGIGGDAGHGPGGGSVGGGGGFGGGGGSSAGFNVDAQPVFTPELFLMAIAFAVVIALVAGLIPSRKAAKLDPVVALKRL